MIACRVIRNDSSCLELPAATQWSFSYGTGLPCDSFYIRCPWDQGREKELSGAALFHAEWNGERVFTGVVDEYACVCGEGGLYLEVSGRGMAARLLDNEAFPARYQRATLTDILYAHVTPYGIEVVGTPFLPPVADYFVSSGVSEWSALYNFTCYPSGTIPRFDRMGRLVLEKHSDAVVFTVDDKSPVTEWTYREQRYGVLSRVAVRQPATRLVHWAENEEFTAQGGCARRIITVPNDTRQGTLRHTADYQLKASQNERVRLSITLAAAFPAWPGEIVEVQRGGFGANGRYRVVRTEVSCDSAGLSTLLELGEPDIMI